MKPSDNPLPKATVEELQEMRSILQVLASFTNSGTSRRKIRLYFHKQIGLELKRRGIPRENN